MNHLRAIGILMFAAGAYDNFFRVMVKAVIDAQKALVAFFIHAAFEMAFHGERSAPVAVLIIPHEAAVLAGHLPGAQRDGKYGFAIERLLNIHVSVVRVKVV